MTVRSPHTQQASVTDASRSQWLPLGTRLPWLTIAVLISAAGCTANGDGFAEDTSDTDKIAADEPTQTALRNGVFATPQSVGGFSVDGVGVYLSALYLTTQEGDHWQTEVAEFEPVTVDAGESRVFREEADGTLMEVFADFAGEEG
jgi:hypothetical protein